MTKHFFFTLHHKTEKTDIVYAAPLNVLLRMNNQFCVLNYNARHVKIFIRTIITNSKNILFQSIFFQVFLKSYLFSLQKAIAKYAISS